MVIPRLEAPRVAEQPGVFELLPWGETEDPTAIVAKLSSGSHTIAVGDQMWARFLVELLPQLPGVAYRRAVDVVGPLRMVKDQAEIDALAAAGAAVDRIAAELQAGRIPLVGRTEAQVSADLSARILAEGHQKVNFAIVAAGENAASPHHHAGSRVIRENEIVLCDFGGTMNGYCSDITRCVFTGDVEAANPALAEAYAVLHTAQQAAFAAAVIGVPCEEVDRTARCDHRRRRLRRLLRASHRARDRHGGARGSVHRRGQPSPARRRPRLQHRARDLRAGGVGHAPRGHRRRQRARPDRHEQGRARRWSTSEADRSADRVWSRRRSARTTSARC